MTMNFVTPLVTRRVPQELVMVKDDLRGWLRSSRERARGSDRKVSVAFVAMLERPLSKEVRRDRQG